ncbi:MAG TPA: 6-phosphogluconolactonase [Thermoanaerobaculia bacterium]|nr:6-phosphogluconolactonase [Thermoanaerobaculia bacterium]
MNLHPIADRETAARAAADLLARAAAGRPELVLGLPTGRTMVPFYAELARRRREGRLDLSRARGFNLDELLLPPGHPASFRAFMERHAWGPDLAGLDPARCDIPDAAAEPAAECARYDRAIAAAGGLDLALLGVGADGHVAYNLPGPPRDETHVVRVPDEVAATLDPPVAPPLGAITMGLGPLRSARHLVLIATTAEKWEAVRALLEGPPDPAWPCSLLRDHPRFDLFLAAPAIAGATLVEAEPAGVR